MLHFTNERQEPHFRIADSDILSSSDEANSSFEKKDCDDSVPKKQIDSQHNKKFSQHKLKNRSAEQQPHNHISVIRKKPSLPLLLPETDTTMSSNITEREPLIPSLASTHSSKETSEYTKGKEVKEVPNHISRSVKSVKDLAVRAQGVFIANVPAQHRALVSISIIALLMPLLFVTLFAIPSIVAIASLGYILAFGWSSFKDHAIQSASDDFGIERKKIESLQESAENLKVAAAQQLEVYIPIAKHYGQELYSYGQQKGREIFDVIYSYANQFKSASSK